MSSAPLRLAIVDGGATDGDRARRMLDLAVAWAPRRGSRRVTTTVVAPDADQLVQKLGAADLVPLSEPDLATRTIAQVVGLFGEQPDLLVIHLPGLIGADELLACDHTSVVVDEEGELVLMVPGRGDIPALDRLRHALQQVDEARTDGAQEEVARTSGIQWAVADDGPTPEARRLLDGAPPDHGVAATAAMLRRLGGRAYAPTADELAHRVDRWLVQRLWSLNEAPELVAHDDRHVARVDRLMAELIEPSVADERLTAAEAALLSAAAWLHDWGHVGGEIDGRWFDQSRDVRYFHGLLTQWLLREPFSAMHGLDPTDATKVGVLCAHHQGWTSFDAGHGRTQTREHRRYRELIELRPASLFKDAKRAGFDEDRAQLLVALLRVADSADVGAHRIPDYEERDDFLVFCGRREAFRLASQLRKEAELAEGPRRSQLESAAWRAVQIASEPDNPFAATALEADPLLAPLLDYWTFLGSTHEHYLKHSLVQRVAFVPDASGRSFRLHVTVTPGTRPNEHSAICRQVSHDVTSELDEKSGGQAREILARHGVEIVGNAVVSQV